MTSHRAGRVTEPTKAEGIANASPAMQHDIADGEQQTNHEHVKSLARVSRQTGHAK